MTGAQVTAAAEVYPTHARLTPDEFIWITNFLRKNTGIELREGKEALVMGRLERRLRHYGLTTYTEYFSLLARPDSREETQLAVDLMTTNETYFFREQAHFDRLAQLAAQASPSQTFRVWSGASSSGEEAYSIAMTLAACIQSRPWEIVGTDLSTRVLETARRALYPIEAKDRIPENLRTAYCLRGVGQHEGLLTIRSELRSRVSFVQANLTRLLPDLGTFDVIFLRNVLIYFGGDTKREVIARVVAKLRPGGVLLIGHAETLTGLGTGLVLVAPSVYREGDI